MSPVEPEAVGDRSRLPATGDAELCEDPGDVETGRLLRDEEFLADLPVGPAFGQQGEHLALAAGQSQGRGRRGQRPLGGHRLPKPEAAALRELPDLPMQRSSLQFVGRLVRRSECCLGSGPGCPAGQKRLGLPKARVGGFEGVLALLPRDGRCPPQFRVGSSFETGQLGAAEQQVADHLGAAGLGRFLIGELVQLCNDRSGLPLGTGHLLGQPAGLAPLGPVGRKP